MQKLLKRAGFTAALAASAFAMTGVAQARDRHDNRDDDIAIAIGAGLVGLAIGAAIADSDDDHYYDRGYYHHRRYVRVDGYPGYYYYYDGYPNRYYRDRYYDRNYGRYYRERYRDRDDRWERRRDRHDDHYGDRYRHDWGERRHGWRD